MQRHKEIRRLSCSQHSQISLTIVPGQPRQTQPEIQSAQFLVTRSEECFAGRVRRQTNRMNTHPTRYAALLALILLVLAKVVAAQTTNRVPKNDVQNWNDFQFTIPVNKKVDFALTGTLRVGDNVSEAVDERFGAAFNYKLNRELTLGIWVFGREARPPNGRREHETRLTLAATYQKPIGKFTLSDRNWFERRWRAPQVDAWRYRNRVRLEHPFQISHAKFTWLVSDEVFYDWSFHEWVRNRVGAGVSHAFDKHLTLELYYMRQNDGRARPGDLHIIGTQWRIKL